MKVSREKIMSILSEVKDPEIPVLSISELGILRNINITDEKISIQITPTYSGWPAMDAIRNDIRRVLEKYGFQNSEIQEVLSPAWTTDWITEEGRNKLHAFGIAPPSSHHCANNGNDQPEFCPNCHSKKTTMISRFGSTSCKALYRCLDCLEPFDYFKCH